MSHDISLSFNISVRLVGDKFLSGLRTTTQRVCGFIVKVNPI